MKRALVISLMILGIGLSAAAAGFTGTWDTDIVITLDGAGAVTVDTLNSLLDIDYTVGDWSFGFYTRLDDAGLQDLSFNIGGNLGAFSLYSFLDFDPTVPSFTSWENVAMVSIAGVDLYAAFVLQEMVDTNIGTGWAIGGHGVAGDVEIWVEADFNLGSGLFYTYNYGYTLYDWDPYYSCVSGGWGSGFWGVQTSSCTPAFSNLDIVVELPLACLDLTVWVNFDCTNGFDYITFMLNDIDLGAGWFQLDDLDIKFTTTSKTITTDFTATFGSAVCITPYFDIVHDVAAVTAIDLDALLLSYTYNGVTIKAGELFPTPGNWYVGFTPSGSLTHYAGCAVPGANEFIGLWFDGDSCCGGLMSASIVMFFDGYFLGEVDNTNGIFDFTNLYADVEVGIGTQFSIRGGIMVSDTDLEVITVGFSFSF